jgi:hypothetical protein
MAKPLSRLLTRSLIRLTRATEAGVPIKKLNQEGPPKKPIPITAIEQDIPEREA